MSKDDKWKSKAQYYRIDTISPIKISLVPPEKRDELEPEEGGQYELVLRIINISGGGLSLRADEKFSRDDILEIVLSLMSNTLVVYGRVLRVETTAGGNYHTYIQFLDMPGRIRERIISFVFHTERNILSNNLLAYNHHFTPIPVRKLVFGTLIPTEIFIKEEDSIKFLFENGLSYDNAAREFLEERGISTIFINDDEMPLFENYLERYRPRHAPATLSFKDYSFHKADYFRVDKRVLLIGEPFNFRTFYISEFTFYSIEDAVQKQPGTTKKELLANARNTLIKRSELRQYKEYLEALSTAGKIPANMLPIVLKERAGILVAEILADPGNADKIMDALAVVDELAACLIENPDSIYALFHLNSGDFYIYIHSVNIAALCIRIGLELKLQPIELKELGIGTLLHDIGYSTINEDIINKMGKLSINEYELLKTHVIEGGKILRTHAVIPLKSYEAVLQHHEWSSGKAYPFNLPEGKMTLFGRLTAICDSFDLMTTSRFHKEPLTYFEALTLLLEKARKKHDNTAAQLVQKLFNLFGNLKSDIEGTQPY